MSSEELAFLARSGDKTELFELWKQVKGYAAAQTRRYPLQDRPDLMQAAFEALYSAIEHFDPARGSFLSVYQFYLKTAFRSAKSGNRRKDPIDTAISLDTLLSEDEDSGTLGDFLEDPDAAGDFEQIEQRELAEAVQRALQTLPERERLSVCLRYCDCLSVHQTAQKIGVTDTEARKIEAAALRKLRHPSIAKVLKSFI